MIKGFLSRFLDSNLLEVKDFLTQAPLPPLHHAKPTRQRRGATIRKKILNLYIANITCRRRKLTNPKIVAGVAIGLIIGLALGIVISIFLLPNIIRNNGLFDSDYTRITVFSGSTAVQEFGNYSYIFHYKVDSYYTSASEGIVVSVMGIYESIPSVAGSTHAILDLTIKVSEVYDDYVVLLVKLS